MHALRRLRSRETIQRCEKLLESTIITIMDPRTYRHLSYDNRQFESSASAPSLRAAEPLLTPPLAATMGEDSANVKVVVRVRQFIKRGIVPAI